MKRLISDSTSQSAVRYMTSISGSGKSIDFYISTCLLKRERFPIIFINDWVDITSVSELAPILLIEMYGMFHSLEGECSKRGKELILQFINNVSVELDTKIRLLYNLVVHCALIIHEFTGLRLCLVFDQINTPFSNEETYKQISRFLKRLADNNFIVQFYISSANNDIDRSGEFFKHIAVEDIPKLTTMPPKELVLLTHAASSTSTSYLQIPLNTEKISLAFTKIDDNGKLTWIDNNSKSLIYNYSGDIPLYVVQLCHSFGDNARDKLSKFVKDVKIERDIGRYIKNTQQEYKKPLFRNMLAIFLGVPMDKLGGSPYDRRYIYEENLGIQGFIYRFASKFVHDIFQREYRDYVEEHIFRLFGVDEPPEICKNLDPTAKGFIVEEYLLAYISLRKKLPFFDSTKTIYLRELQTLALSDSFNLNDSLLSADSDFLIRPPHKYPIHDAYVLVQSESCLNESLSLINIEHSQHESKRGILFSLQITIGDVDKHYMRDHMIGEENFKKLAILNQVTEFVEAKNLYFAEIYISPTRPTLKNINWIATTDIYPFIDRLFQ